MIYGNFISIWTHTYNYGWVSSCWQPLCFYFILHQRIMNLIIYQIGVIFVNHIHSQSTRMINANKCKYKNTFLFKPKIYSYFALIKYTLSALWVLMGWARFHERSTRDRFRYDPVILIGRSHSTNADHDRLMRSRKYETKQFIAHWIMT